MQLQLPIFLSKVKILLEAVGYSKMEGTIQ